MKKKISAIVLTLILILVIYNSKDVIVPFSKDLIHNITSLQTYISSDETSTGELSSNEYVPQDQKSIAGYSSDKYQSYINSIINTNISQEMSMYQKVKIIHDYIIINTSYDTTEGEIPDSSFSPEGVLTKGVAVCQGYAETFQLFMDSLGIECQIVTGTANNISHAWNVVKIDGEWYNIDVTWDDPVVNNEVVTGTDNLCYSYFLKPDSVFYKDHIPTSNPVPCSSTTFLYTEQYYNIPYTILGSVYEIPDVFMDYYSQGIHNLTMYFPEDINPEDTELLTDLYKNLYYKTGTAVTFSYYPVTRYLDYSYITIFVE